MAKNSAVAIPARKSAEKPQAELIAPGDFTPGDVGVIIQDGDKLSAYLTKAISMYADAGRLIHCAFVSALWHAAKHGNTAHLNRVFTALRSNDQGAARAFIRRASIIVGLGGVEFNINDVQDGQALARDADEINAAFDNGKIMEFKNKTFSMIKGFPERRALMLELCEKRLINPDGKRDQPMLVRNNFAELRELGDDEVLKGLKATIQRSLSADGKNEGNRRVHLSGRVRDLLAKFGGQVETMLNLTEESLNKG